MNEEHRMGFIEATPYLFAQIESLGVPARVWDEVIGEMFDLTAWSHLPGAFNQILADVTIFNGKQYDYSRGEGLSDHDYARALLMQADADIVAGSIRSPHAVVEGEDRVPGLDVPEE